MHASGWIRDVRPPPYRAKRPAFAEKHFVMEVATPSKTTRASNNEAEQWTVPGVFAEM